MHLAALLLLGVAAAQPAPLAPDTPLTVEVWPDGGSRTVPALEFFGGSLVPKADAGGQSSPSPAPRNCAAPNVVGDGPCPGLGGTFRIHLAPAAGKKRSCLLTRAVDAELRVEGDGRLSSADLRGLVAAFHMSKRAIARSVAGGAKRGATCCIDVDLYDDSGPKVRRVVLHLARGATRVTAKAKDATPYSCEEDLEVSATLK